MINNPPSSQRHAEKSIVMVAWYEAIKGVVALLAAMIIFVWHDKLLWLMHIATKDLHQLLGRLLAQQIDSLNHYAEIANQNWLKAFWLVIGYAVLRFVEAYGLYRDKTWAYWYSVLGYAIFVPLEIYEIVSKPFDWFKLLIFVLNILILVVVYKKMVAKGLLPSINYRV